MQPSRDVSRLVEIMRALRDPNTGCPWDVEQDFDSIVPYTIEETYEVVDAIERRDPVDLREELGDLLLQVVYYAQLAEETGLFDFGDIVETVTRKMVRRHPHVFGAETARSAHSAKGQWERIKAEERAEKAAIRRNAAAASANGAMPEWSASLPNDATPSILDKVPPTFPALLLSLKLQSAAATVGFDWTSVPPILEKLREEIGEFEDALDNGTRAEQADELGDLLFCAVNLARRLEIDPDQALRGTASKFRRRFGAMERAAVSEGRSLDVMTLDEMEALWQRAKVGERAPAAEPQPI
nr:nucleoside triphosphate pyrophosphohydrolase [Aureimonas mangrovi]